MGFTLIPIPLSITALIFWICFFALYFTIMYLDDKYKIIPLQDGNTKIGLVMIGVGIFLIIGLITKNLWSNYLGWFILIILIAILIIKATTLYADERCGSNDWKILKEWFRQKDSRKKSKISEIKIPSNEGVGVRGYKGRAKVSLERKCSICGNVELLINKCIYCGHIYCSDHHLPENHNCFGLRK